MDLSVIDIVVVVAVIYSVYHGYTKGLIISLASLAGLALGVWGSVKFSNVTATYLSQEFDLHIPILAFALTFIIILFGIYFLGKLIEKAVNIMSLGMFNKFGGAVFNAVKMTLILVVAFILFNKVNTKFKFVDESKISAAYVYPYLKALEKTLMPMVDKI